MTYKAREQCVNIYFPASTQVIPLLYYFDPTGVKVLDSLNSRSEKRSRVTCKRHLNNPYYRSHAEICLHLKCKHIFAYRTAYISLIDIKSTPCIDVDLRMIL